MLQVRVPSGDSPQTGLPLLSLHSAVRKGDHVIQTHKKDLHGIRIRPNYFIEELSNLSEPILLESSFPARPSGKLPAMQF